MKEIIKSRGGVWKTQKNRSIMCRDVLGGTPSRGFGFDPKNMEQLDKLFNLELDMTDMTGSRCSGMGGYVSESDNNQES